MNFVSCVVATFAFCLADAKLFASLRVLFFEYDKRMSEVRIVEKAPTLSFRTNHQQKKNENEILKCEIDCVDRRFVAQTLHASSKIVSHPRNDESDKRNENEKKKPSESSSTKQ